MCVPYSQRACFNASIHQGLQLGGNGKKFIDYHGTKGCHAIGGFAYYGIELTQKNLHRTSLLLPFFRPNGYDCGKKS